MRYHRNGRSIAWSLLLSVGLTACGGGGGGGDDPSDEEIANAIVQALTVIAPNTTIQELASAIPDPSADPDRPTIVSQPDDLTGAASGTEKIELGVEANSQVAVLYISVQGATRTLQIEFDQPLAAGFTGISFQITLPGTIDTDQFCLLASVADALGRVSTPGTSCVNVAQNDPGGDRLIHFATFEASSLLGTFDLDLSSVQGIGRSGVQLTDIAFLGNELYGVSFTDLYRLDPATGVATHVLNLGTTGANSLVGRNGLLYAATTASEFYRIDPSVPSVSFVGFLGMGAESSGDLAFLDDGRLVLTAKISGFLNDQLFEVDIDTGAVTLIGDTGFVDVFGIAIFRSQLFGVTFGGDLILIRQATGAGALLSPDGPVLAGGATAAALNQGN